MLLGSLPVAFLVAPMVTAGAFLLHADKSATWGAAATATLTVAAASQVVCMLAAMYYIEKRSSERVDEIAAYPNDAEVERPVAIFTHTPHTHTHTHDTRHASRVSRLSFLPSHAISA